MQLIPTMEELIVAELQIRHLYSTMDNNLILGEPSLQQTKFLVALELTNQIKQDERQKNDNN